MNRLKEAIYQCKDWFLDSISGYQRQFFWLFGIYLLAFSAIFRANFAYWDDVGRTYAGYHGWLDWSRYGTEILATFVHAGWRLTDISPLPQLLACAVMAAGGILLLRVFGKGQKIGVFQVLAASLTALAPYFLGMISYKFDSPYMALSFLVCVIPFLFYEKSPKLYAVVSVFCLLMMCTTYQASSGVYPMIALFLAMEAVTTGKSLKESARFLGISAVCYLVSLGVFWIFLMRDNGVSVLSPASLFSTVFHRYLIYYETVYRDFSKIWLILSVMIVLLFLYTVCKTAVIPKAAALGMGVLTVFIGSALCFGANLFISREAFDARSMYGFNVFLTLLAVYVAFGLKSWIPKAVYGILAWSFLIFALTFGNALARQQEYRNYRAELLAADLNALEIMQTEEEKEIQIVGDIGYSPVILRMAEVYPILNRESFSEEGEGIICSGLGEGIWGGYYFYYYLNLPHVRMADGGEDWKNAGNLPILRDTAYHTIRGSGGKIVVELK
ncbi:MAG: glucosyltransferase domain-containing protein [Blautia sp.]|nr:glucosyltransferase domain-containing protein [Lachnoclostridium sp.]MCM1211635.1 glucosyltransferase domain-containing protein [Blautia sp.]